MSADTEGRGPLADHMPGSAAPGGTGLAGAQTSQPENVGHGCLWLSSLVRGTPSWGPESPRLGEKALTRSVHAPLRRPLSSVTVAFNLCLSASPHPTLLRSLIKWNKISPGSLALFKNSLLV